MTYTVYCICLNGSPEVRYVGRTYKDVAVRLREHRGTPCCPHLSLWLRKNEAKVEIFPIAKCENEVTAKATERAAISFYAAVGHRLFNRTHNPVFRAGLAA